MSEQKVELAVVSIAHLYRAAVSRDSTHEERARENSQDYNIQRSKLP